MREGKKGERVPRYLGMEGPAANTLRHMPTTLLGMPERTIGLDSQQTRGGLTTFRRKNAVSDTRLVTVGSAELVFGGNLARVDLRKEAGPTYMLDRAR